MNLFGHYVSTPLEGGPLGRQGSSVLYTLVPHRYTQVPRYHTAGLGGAGATTEIQWGEAQSQQGGGAGRGASGRWAEGGQAQRGQEAQAWDGGSGQQEQK